jgi:hypothetical protein
MDGKHSRDHDSSKSTLCRLEWIAAAIDAARRHKEDEQRAAPPAPRRRPQLVKA